MAEIKKKVTGGYSYDVPEYGYQINYYSDIYDGEILDTEVCLDPDNNPGVHLCVIAGTDIKAFNEEFAALITKYRI